MQRGLQFTSYSYRLHKWFTKAKSFNLLFASTQKTAAISDVELLIQYNAIQYNTIHRNFSDLTTIATWRKPLLKLSLIYMYIFYSSLCYNITLYTNWLDTNWKEIAKNCGFCHSPVDIFASAWAGVSADRRGNKRENRQEDDKNHCSLSGHCLLRSSDAYFMYILLYQLSEFYDIIHRSPWKRGIFDDVQFAVCHHLYLRVPRGMARLW